MKKNTIIGNQKKYQSQPKVSEDSPLASRLKKLAQIRNSSSDGESNEVDKMNSGSMKSLH